MPLNRTLLVLCLALLLIIGCGGGSDTEPIPFLLGAHYYTWYPETFGAFNLRMGLNPPQRPVLGIYDSFDPAVAEQHIAWAADCGIDFFTMQYGPTWSFHLRDAMDQGFLRAPNIDRIKFCMFYGTGELGNDDSPEVGAAIMNMASRDQLVADMLYFADHYFPHPSYLRVEGRPVVFFYTTRVLIGEYVRAFQDARAALEARGINPLFIADEIWWAVCASGPDPANPVLEISTEPLMDRIRLFDAITFYSVIFDQMPEHDGYLTQSSHLEDTNRLMARYRASVPDIPILPTITPSFNDHGVRPDHHNPVIPREAAPGASVMSTFEMMYDQHLIPNLDARLPMALITSWNEWNEDTAIEPLAPAPPASGEDIYTQGYLYEGFGTAYLDFLRSRRMGDADPSVI